MVNKGLLTINREYEKNKDLCFERFKIIMEAFDVLPFEADETELIAVFDECYMGNPYYFNINKQGYSELIDFLDFYYREFEGKTCDMIIKDDDLLAMMGLIKNEVQISTLECGFEGVDAENKEHIGLKSF